DSAGVIINEAAAKFMRLQNPVGETIQRNDKNYTILGVVKDMVMQSPYNPAVPTIFSILSFNGGIVSVKINPNADMNEALNKIKAVFKAYVPDMPFEYKFADDEYAKKFAAEIRTSNNIANNKLPSNKSSNGESGEEFKNGVINLTISPI